MSLIKDVRDEAEKLKTVVESSKPKESKVWSHLIAASCGAAIAVAIMEAFR
jgi:hypothetical protein